VAYTFRHGDRPLEGYTIQRAVGRGGFGEVYYAMSDGGREVALKYLRENPNIELRGVSHCMNLKSPHLVSIFDVRKNDQGEYFVVMEYVSGPSLRDLLLAEPNGLGPQKAAFFIREIAKGLAYLHDRGVVHRDLKPGNIFYDEGYVKIGDYGLSKFISVSRHSAQTASVGTVHYMAPEVGSGNYHRGIDIYALGVMLYEMLLGRVPYEGSSMGEVLMKHLTAQPEVDNLPAPFGKVIRKALEKDPAHRYQNVYEMVDDLLEVEGVQNSLAGFNPASLSTVPRHPAPDAFDSPAPSPNPPPARVPERPGKPVAFDLDAGRLPPKMAKRVAAIGDKIDKRLHKLEGKHGPRVPAPEQPRKRKTKVLRPRIDNAPRSRGEIVQRLLLALAMAVGLGFGLGFIVDAREEGFASAIMMIVGMSGGLALGMRFMAYLGRHAPQPRWIERISLTVPTAGLLAIGVLPFAKLSESMAVGVWLALLVVTFIVNWREHVESGANGEMSLWRAGKLAILALIFTAILTGGRDHAMVLGVGVAAATSFVLQALAWLFPLRAWLDGGGGSESNGTPESENEKIDEPKVIAVQTDEGSEPARFHGYRRSPDTPPMRSRTLTDDSMAPSGHESSADPANAPSFVVTGAPRRHLITRLAAGLAVLLLLAFIGVLLLSGNMSPHVQRAQWVANTSSSSAVAVSETRMVRNEWLIAASALLAGSCGLLLLAARKMSRHRTGGFYRDTLRPLLLALVMAGLAAMGTGIAVMGPQADVSRAFLVLLILFAMAFLFLLVKRGRRYPRLDAACSSGDANHRGPAREVRRPLRRNMPNRQIAGVCAGLADYLGLDVTHVRVAYVLLSVFSAAFPGILVYIILWLIVPEHEGDIRRRKSPAAAQ